MILLPGIGDFAHDFELNGFIEAVDRHRVTADAIAVDLHLGYYVRHRALEQLQRDVLEPAHAAGYTSIYVVGISLGGFGATLYAMEHASDIQGLILLAPYLGDSALANEIRTAGGLLEWKDEAITPDDHLRRLWRWLKRCALERGGSSMLRNIYLGYGTKDSFAPANALLADILPAENVFTVPGGHDWRTWKRLWNLFLTR